MFEIKKVSSIKLYTHHIHFKGNLISSEGYIYNNLITHENYNAIDIQEILKIKVGDFHDNMKLKFEDYFIHKEFNLCAIQRQTHKLTFTITSFSDRYNQSVWNPLLFFQVIMEKAGSFQFESFIYSDENGIELKCSYESYPHEQIVSIYNNAVKDFSKLCQAAEDAMLEKALKQSTGQLV